MNLLFILIATSIVASVTLWLGSVLWRGSKSRSDVAHHDVNATVLRDQLFELEQDRAYGTLSTQSFEEAKQDLHRRVLNEATPTQTIEKQSSSRHTYAAIALIVSLPVATTLTYLSLGEPSAMVTQSAQRVATVTQADVQSMVDSLAARLADNPDDPAGWLMLARSYRHFEQHDHAAMAFEKARAVIQTDPQALSEFAESLVRSGQEGFRGEPTQLLDRALLLNPRHPFALTLAGAAALERADYVATIEYWERLLAQLPPDSEAAQIVSTRIEQARLEQTASMSLVP